MNKSQTQHGNGVPNLGRSIVGFKIDLKSLFNSMVVRFLKFIKI